MPLLRVDICKRSLQTVLLWPIIHGIWPNAKASGTLGIGKPPLLCYEMPRAMVASPQCKDQYPDFRSLDQRLPIPFLINEPKCIFRQLFTQLCRKMF